MKRILFLFFVLWVVHSEAQTFYSREYTIPISGTETHLYTTADGNFAYAGYSDTLLSITRIDKATGQVIRTKAFSGVAPSTLPDSRIFAHDALFFPAQDTGMVVLFRRVNNRFPIQIVDSAYSTIIKFDKQLNLQWAFTYAAPDHAGITPSTIQSAVTDIAGNVYVNYAGTWASGLMKISATGTLLATQEFQAPMTGSLFAVDNNRFLLPAFKPDYSDSTTTIDNYVINDQLQVLHKQSYRLPWLYYLNFGFNEPVYHQPLIAGSVNEVIFLSGGGLTQKAYCYYVLDTTGRICKLAKYNGSTVAAPFSNINISADNKLQIAGKLSNTATGSTSFAQVSDTSGNIIFAKQFDVNSQFFQAPYLRDTDLFWPSNKANAPYILAYNLTHSKADGSAFCPASQPYSGITTTSLPFDTVTTVLPTITNGTVIHRNVVQDTLAMQAVGQTVACVSVTETGIGGLNNNDQGVSASMLDQHRMQLILPASFNNGSMELRDVSGRLILRQALLSQKEIIAIPDVAAGIYIWHVYGKSGQQDAGKLFLQ